MGKLPLKLQTKNALAEARSAERRGIALDLRKKGCNYRQIAQIMRDRHANGEAGSNVIPPSYGPKNSYDDVKKEMARQIAENGEAAETVRQMELIRLDHLLTALQSGINKGDVQAINTAIRIGESRRRLQGLDAPTCVETVNLNAELSPEYAEEMRSRISAKLLKDGDK